MNKHLCQCLFVVILVGSIWRFSIPSGVANAQAGDRINSSATTLPEPVLNNTDYAWNTTLVGNQSLVNSMQGVLPRVVVEYADTMFQPSVHAPQGLNGTIVSRIIVEYADYSNTKGIQKPQGLNGTIASRIIVEYADSASITHTMIAGDLNGDGKVSIQDLVILGNAYGSQYGMDNDGHVWNLKADIDGSGVVGLSDLVILAEHYGQHYS